MSEHRADEGYGRVRKRRLPKALALAGIAILLIAALVTVRMIVPLCLFSEVRGVVLDHGKPVAGVSVTRSWLWHLERIAGLDSSVTDQDGRFQFPGVPGRSLSGLLLPHDPLIEQKILIEYGGKSYRAWLIDKRDYDDNGELDGRPINLVCRLENPLKHREGVFGICEIN